MPRPPRRCLSDWTSLYCTRLASRRPYPLIQLGKSLRRPHIVPFALEQLPVQTPGRNRALEQWQQRKLPRLRARKELRPVDTDTGISKTVGLALDDPIALETEIAARVLC